MVPVPQAQNKRRSVLFTMYADIKDLKVPQIMQHHLQFVVDGVLRPPGSIASATSRS